MIAISINEFNEPNYLCGKTANTVKNLAATLRNINKTVGKTDAFHFQQLNCFENYVESNGGKTSQNIVS